MTKEFTSSTRRTYPLSAAVVKGIFVVRIDNTTECHDEFSSPFSSFEIALKFFTFKVFFEYFSMNSSINFFFF